MNHFRSILVTTLLLLVLNACSDSKLLTRQIMQFPQPLGYAIASSGQPVHKTADLVVDYYGLELNHKTRIRKGGSIILPFIIVNYFNIKYQIRLGEDLMKDDYNQFFYQSLLNESEAKGRYKLCFDSITPRSAYRLAVYLNECTASTAYCKKTLAFVTDKSSSTSYWESGNPAKSRISCRIVLSKWDSVLCDTVLTEENKLPFPGSSGMSREALLDYSAGNMVEALCRSTSQCVNAIIARVNNEIAR